MLKRRQRQQRYYYRSKIVPISLLAGLLFCLIVLGIVKESAEVLPAAAFPPVSGQRGILQPEWSEVLSSGIPGLVAGNRTVVVQEEFTPQHFLRGAIMLFTGVDIKDLRSFFHSEIPLLAAIKPGAPTVSAMSLPNFPKFDSMSVLSGGKPLVGIYHTHTAESFIPSSGAAHKPGGQRGDIVAVGEAMVQQLAKDGVPAIQSKTIHDYPSFMKAYGASEITVKNMLAENPSLQIILDIHRDAGKREDVTASVNGVSAARILLVVATGQKDLEQPHWKENHAFAKLIDAKLNQHYPGLSRGIELVEWRYNQQLHPRALLLEVGCQENTKEEAQRSIEMLADVLAEIINESKNQ
ncbi:MAG: stage II sporulation protein P [Veillonellales bacterium]